MGDQPTLWDSLPGDEGIQARFEAFHQEHPDVYQLFRRFAMELKDAGRKRFGAKAIMEVIRYYHATSSQGDKPFKINNSFTSRYVRMLIEERPELEGIFELRRIKAE